MTDRHRLRAGCASAACVARVTPTMTVAIAQKPGLRLAMQAVASPGLIPVVATRPARQGVS